MITADTIDWIEDSGNLEYIWCPNTHALISNPLPILFCATEFAIWDKVWIKFFSLSSNLVINKSAIKRVGKEESILQFNSAILVKKSCHHYHDNARGTSKPFHFGKPNVQSIGCSPVFLKFPSLANLNKEKFVKKHILYPLTSKTQDQLQGWSQ